MDLSQRFCEESIDTRYLDGNEAYNTIPRGEEEEPAASTLMEEARRLIEAEIPFLRLAVRRWQRTAADADDLLQATLLRALANAHLWQPGSNLRAWLVTIMRNELFTELGRCKRRSAAADAEEVAAHHPAAAETRLVLRDVERALLRLPPVQRLTVLLAGVEGRSYEEVARIMELSVDAVRCHLARARARLRQSVYLGEETSPVRCREPRAMSGLPTPPPAELAPVVA